MADFSFIKNAVSKRWVVSAPRRAKRPDAANGTVASCPFCPGNESERIEYYRIGGSPGDSSWEIRVIPNKFPFAPIHELVIETPEHHSSYEKFSVEHIERILQTFRQRFNEHSHKGQVYIFHNHGEKGGESIPHSHTQIVVIPEKVYLDIPRLESVEEDIRQGIATDHFSIVCPRTSIYPDEVWVTPKIRGRTFGEATDDELGDLSGIILGLITIFNLRYNTNFPYNFYFYPGEDWYFRLIPRLKTMGGFEIGTKVFVNTQKPEETLAFIKEHLQHPDIEKILKEHQAEYHRTV